MAIVCNKRGRLGPLKEIPKSPMAKKNACWVLPTTRRWHLRPKFRNYAHIRPLDILVFSVSTHIRVCAETLQVAEFDDVLMRARTMPWSAQELELLL